MEVVLGLDAAWTAGEPSGVALVSGDAGAWTCVALAPSYAAFVAMASGEAVNWRARIEGGVPDAAQLLDAARKLVSTEVDIVAVDMPIATMPINGRRAADNIVSKRFGAAGCGTHSPSAVRPGPMSDALRGDFERLGFPVITGCEPAKVQRGLIEVYPHVALLKLLSRSYRLECKVTKVRKYWPRDDPKLRLQRLLACWNDILAALSSGFEGIALELPDPGSVRSLSWLKRYEDALDALVSAWMGTLFLEAKAEACGDDTAAIWIPK